MTKSTIQNNTNLMKNNVIYNRTKRKIVFAHISTDIRTRKHMYTYTCKLCTRIYLKQIEGPLKIK